MYRVQTSICCHLLCCSFFPLHLNIHWLVCMWSSFTFIYGYRHNSALKCFIYMHWQCQLMPMKLKWWRYNFETNKQVHILISSYWTFTNIFFRYIPSQTKQTKKTRKSINAPARASHPRKINLEGKLFPLYILSLLLYLSISFLTFKILLLFKK